MQLSLPELARCMNTDPGTVERWIRQGRIPVKRRGDLCFFSREAMAKWAETHRLSFVMPGSETAVPAGEEPIGLLAAMEQGGLYYDVPGTTVGGVLREAVDRMAGLGSPVSRDLVYEKLLDRERMMSTGIGNGVAVPHPRTPVQHEGIRSQIATCFLAHPVDFRAVDKKPVHLLFVLVASSAKHHLLLLSRLSYCLKDESFLELLNSRSKPDSVLEAVVGFESRLD